MGKTAVKGATGKMAMGNAIQDNITWACELVDNTILIGAGKIFPPNHFEEYRQTAFKVVLSGLLNLDPNCNPQVLEHVYPYRM